MKTKNVVVVYYGDDWKKDIPLRNAPQTRISFEDWHERGLKHGINMYRASLKWYDVEKNIFKKAWAYRNKRWSKIKSPIIPDMIFDKIMGKRNYQLLDYKLEISKKTKLFNHPLFRVSVDNKLTQYLLMKEFMPRSYLATTKKELIAILTTMATAKVVVKPLHGSGGIGIVIDKKAKVLNKRFAYPVLVQEFIKSEKGIPGFSQKKEVADLRMIFMNHKFIYALSRIAKKGSLFTNFHQGATAILVPKKQIPKNVTLIANSIIKKLKTFPEANYSLDFIFTNKGRPFLVEMNTTPGFDLLHIVGDEKTKDKNFAEFIKLIK